MITKQQFESFVSNKGQFNEETGFYFIGYYLDYSVSIKFDEENHDLIISVIGSINFTVRYSEKNLKDFENLPERLRMLNVFDYDVVKSVINDIKNDK